MTRRGFIAGGLLLGALLYCQTTLPAAESPVGSVAATEGETGLIRRFKKLPVEQGKEVIEKDYVKTGQVSRVDVSLVDGSLLVVGERSFVRLEKPGGGKDKQEDLIELLSGTLRVKVVPQSGERVFSVKTPTAVVGVRGTEFTVAHRLDADGRGRSFVTVFEGRVEVTRLLPDGHETLRSGDRAVLTPGSQVSVDSHQEGGVVLRELSRSELKAVDAYLPLHREVEMPAPGERGQNRGGKDPKSGAEENPQRPKSREPAEPGESRRGRRLPEEKENGLKKQGEPLLPSSPPRLDPFTGAAVPGGRTERAQFEELSSGIHSAGVTSLQSVVSPGIMEALRPATQVLEQAQATEQRGQEVKDLPPGPPSR